MGNVSLRFRFSCVLCSLGIYSISDVGRKKSGRDRGGQIAAVFLKIGIIGPIGL